MQDHVWQLDYLSQKVNALCGSDYETLLRSCLLRRLQLLAAFVSLLFLVPNTLPGFICQEGNLAEPFVLNRHV